MVWICTTYCACTAITDHLVRLDRTLTTYDQSSIPVEPCFINKGLEIKGRKRKLGILLQYLSYLIPSNLLQITFFFSLTFFFSSGLHYNIHGYYNSTHTHPYTIKLINLGMLLTMNELIVNRYREKLQS